MIYGRPSGRMALDRATGPPSLHGDTKGVSVFWIRAEVRTLLVRDESLCAAGKRAWGNTPGQLKRNINKRTYGKPVPRSI